MKKVVTSALASSLLLGTVASTGFAATSGFSDIQNSYAKDAILELQSKGILTGVDGTHFNPKAVLTRAEYVTIVVKALGLGIEEGSKAPFTDVPSWAAPYVAAAVQAGLVDGVGGGKFDPNAPVTREMATVILVRALQATGVVLDGQANALTFKDAKEISAWAKDYIGIAVKYGLIQGNPDGSFSPKGKASREMAAVLGSNLLAAIAQFTPAPTDSGVTDPEVAQPETPETTPTTPSTTPSTPSSGGSSGGGGGGGGGYIPPTTPEVTLSSIAITTPAKKLAYVIGEDLDLTGMVVTGTYSDGSKGTVAVTAANVSGYDKTKEGSQTLTVTVNGKTTTFTVTVAKEEEETATLSSIEITKLPTKVEYAIGEELDLTGLEVTGHYSDDTTKVLNVTAENVTGFDSSAAAESQVVTVTIDGQTATFNVSIKGEETPPVEATLTGIEITSPPAKLTYNVGEELDLTGLEVTGHYSDDTTKVLEVKADNISGFDSSAAAEDQVVTVTINGKTATFNVTIVAEEPPVSEPVEITNVHIESNNGTNSTMAKVGDTVTLVFNTKEEVSKLGNFKINGSNPTSFSSTQDGDVWTNVATYIIEESDPDGVVNFQINVENAAGVYSITTEATTDGSSVTVQKEAPVISAVSIASNHAADPSKAAVGDTVTLTFVTNQEVTKLGNFKINGGNPVEFNSVAGENGWTNTATYVIDETDPVGAMNFQINVQNGAGLYSITTEATTDETSVTVVDPIAAEDFSKNVSDAVYGGYNLGFRLNLSYLDYDSIESISATVYDGDDEIAQVSANTPEQINKYKEADEEYSGGLDGQLSFDIVSSEALDHYEIPLIDGIYKSSYLEYTKPISEEYTTGEKVPTSATVAVVTKDGRTFTAAYTFEAPGDTDPGDEDNTPSDESLAALEQAKGGVALLEEEAYTEDSWAALTEALALPETTNADVVAKTAAINDAVSSLVLKDVTPAVISNASLKVEDGGLVLQFSLNEAIDLGTQADIQLSYFTKGEDGTLTPINNNRAGDEPLVKSKLWSGYLWDTDSAVNYSQGYERDTRYSDDIPANANLATLVKKGYHSSSQDMDYVDIDWTQPATYVVEIYVVDNAGNTSSQKVEFTVEAPTTPTDPEADPSPEV